MTCSRPWHNLAGRTRIRAQAFMPHTSLLHIVLSLRLRNQEGFGNRFPVYFMFLWFRWGVRMKAGPHCVSIIDACSLFSRVWTQLPVCSFLGYLSYLSNSHTCTDVAMLGLDEDLHHMDKRCYVNLKIMPLLVLIPFRSGLFDITMIVMIIITGVSMNIFLCYQFCSLSNRLLTQIDCLLNGPIPIERQNRSKSILLLLLICY